jgi:hypothetical protein
MRAAGAAAYADAFLALALFCGSCDFHRPPCDEVAVDREVELRCTVGCERGPGDEVCIDRKCSDRILAEKCPGRLERHPRGVLDEVPDGE